MFLQVYKILFTITCASQFYVVAKINQNYSLISTVFFLPMHVSIGSRIWFLTITRLCPIHGRTKEDNISSTHRILHCK